MHTQPNHHQAGFASIAIALVLIIVMGLLSVGFAQLARREQQSALNSQLATQAYYAAESGINDVTARLQSIIATNPDPTACLTPAQIGVTNTDVNAATGASYTCAIVDNELQDQPYELSANDSNTSVFTTKDPINQLSVSWKGGADTQLPTLPPAQEGLRMVPDWKYPALMEFRITPLVNPASFDRNTLVDNTFTAYLYPTATNGSNTVPYANAANLPGQGKIVSAYCTGGAGQEKNCKATITGLPSGQGLYYLAYFKAYYRKTTLDITEAKTAATGAATTFKNGLVAVDVTGKSRNVLKRIRAYVPLNTYAASPAGAVYDLPDYALQAGDICKRAATYPGVTGYVSTGGTKLGPNDDDPCNLNN